MENLLSVEELLTQLRNLDESQHIEAKRGSDVGASIMQTICAYANEPGLGGGYLLLGVEEKKESTEGFVVCGVPNVDRVLNDLQTNCREQFERPVPIAVEALVVENKKVIRVFVPELDVASKPCTFKGGYDKRNKRKTGVWRRGGNGDYECSTVELEPLLLAKIGLGYEQTKLPDAHWDDLDPHALQLYRTLRAQVRPHAEELLVSDEEMLYALNLVYKKDTEWAPNIAGLLLFGKPLALRRLLPAVRVDYIRIVGTKWVEDPEQRFEHTLDLREPLIRLIPRLEATIIDDLPKHFKLEEGEIQRTDQPILPRKVLREAVVNALMHRDYQVHQPVIVVRYSNRIEIRNAGYSLKPELMLGEMGSKLRNPILASVLYDIHFAETKGSGIRTMRQLLARAGVSPPVFTSNVLENHFTATYLLHQLLSEDQLGWLQRFTHLSLTDNEAKVLIFARETGAIDNASVRSITGLDTLAVSQLLRRLTHDYGLLRKGGASSATYYQLNDDELPLFAGNTGDLVGNTGDLVGNTGDLVGNTGDLVGNTGDLVGNTGDLGDNTGDLGGNTGDLTKNKASLLPRALVAYLGALGKKPRKERLQPAIVWMCALRPYRAEELATLLNRQVNALKSSHLNPLRDQYAYINYLYPDVVNHPEQAYVATNKGRRWLAQQGIDVADE